ncbi:glycosyltransferase family 2 protein [Rhodopirellula sp. JC740]|uniref:Glycosyltransferase family 2 protein n=1 Tax=Rhodopirellula halodulae TaxID=2894198 RepID=A0ABS8NJI4_9BACT|nr:glycosyltransferase family 2 protein [Rhodopirellula sp. JC740]MCC9643729.1 glycosyltransferase family 2 protein [Rhodopirellula sp. JC740]
MATPMKPEISVIITTFNAPDELWLVLVGYQMQTERNFEILIADDGSDSKTAAVIERFRQTCDIETHHVWHEDAGFRKCEILNRAIEQANSDYLLFTDGDCIPRPDFLAVHLREAEPKRFLSGTYNNLPKSFKGLITESNVRSGIVFQSKWLRENGMPQNFKSLRLIQSKALTSILNRLTTTRPTWNGCNVSGWKSDVMAVNGYDERMRYGGLDREIGLRMNNLGIRGKQIRFKAICLHVDHPRGYMNDEDLKKNLSIRNETIRGNVTRTPYGIQRDGIQRAA